MININKLGINKSVIEELGLIIGNDNGVLEIQVPSFSAFDDLLSLIGDTENYFKTFNRFYRGVSDKTYGLEPSLVFKGLEEVESDMINQFYLSSPESFTHCSSNYEKLALMQHYGLPTRLLDFTKNPLVAAWFACKDNTKGKDAAVYVALSNMRASYRFIGLVCSFAFQDEDIFDIKGVNAFISNDDLRYYISYLFMNSSFDNFVDAPAFDQREKNQQSVFLLGVNKPILIKTNDLAEITRIEYSSTHSGEFFSFIDNETPSFERKIIPGHIECYNKEKDSHFLIKIIIPSSIKDCFCKELKIRGITKEYIYPSLSNCAERISDDFINNKDYYSNLKNLIK